MLLRYISADAVAVQELRTLVLEHKDQTLYRTYFRKEITIIVEPVLHQTHIHVSPPGDRGFPGMETSVLFGSVALAAITV